MAVERFCFSLQHIQPLNSCICALTEDKTNWTTEELSFDQSWSIGLNVFDDVCHADIQQCFGRRCRGWAVFCCFFEVLRWPSCLPNESSVIPFILVCISNKSQRAKRMRISLHKSSPVFSALISVLFQFFCVACFICVSIVKYTVLGTSALLNWVWLTGPCAVEKQSIAAGSISSAILVG